MVQVWALVANVMADLRANWREGLAGVRAGVGLPGAGAMGGVLAKAAP